MWQKVDGKYHNVFYGKTLCGKVIKAEPNKLNPYPMSNKCGFCSGVSHLINTSVDEAKRYYLKNERRVPVLRVARDLTNSVTLRRAIDSRLRKLEKEKE